MKIAIVSDLEGFGWAGCEELWAALAATALASRHQVAFLKSREFVTPEKIKPLQALGLQLIEPSAGAQALHAVRKRISWKLASIAAPWFPSFDGLRGFKPNVLFISGGEAIPRPEFLDDLEKSGAFHYPYVLIAHNSYLFGKPIGGVAQERAARYYREARKVLFVAERTWRDTEHLLATHLSDAAIVRNPVNMQDAGALPMPSGDAVRIACLGRLSMNSKGQDLLLAALGSPQFRARDWMLSIYGDGPHRQQMKVLAEHYGVSERVAFRGHVQDIRAIWAQHHMLALPSRNESAPLVLVEAMLCGRPCVATDVGGIGKWISEPATGFIAQGIHVESYASALDRAWAARSEWEYIGLAAREKALAMVDTDPGKTLLDMLNQICGSDET